MISRLRVKELLLSFLFRFDAIINAAILIRRIFFQRHGYTQPALRWAVVAPMLIFMSTPLLAQNVASKLGPFQEVPRVDNPIREPLKTSTRPTPTVVDLDLDGKDDVVVADYYGAEGLNYYYNTSTATRITFTRLQHWDNPFEFISFPLASFTAFSDFDNDGDPDMLVGNADGTFRYYRRNSVYTSPFSQQVGEWNASTKAGNPMHNVDLGAYSAPVFADMDSDGDDDLIVGASYSAASKSIHYFINDGAGTFSASTLTGINPQVEEATPSLLDVDGDGDLDIIVGDDAGNLHYFKRTGATTFEEQVGANNPFNGINKGIYASPARADFDNDGDDDLILGAQSADFDLFYFENQGNSVFQEKTSFDNPFGGVTTGSDSAPLLADVDFDGDLDMFIGNSRNYIKYLENDNGKLTEVTNHPFSTLPIGDKFSPSFVDIDGDSDKDLLGSVSATNTAMVYFRNDGGVFTDQTVASGLFPSVISAEEGHADFGDIDGDGDFDMIISDGTFSWSTGDHSYIRFFRNAGTPLAPVFTEITGAGNPLALVDEEFVLFPRFIDIDHDGDLDVIIGEGGDTIEISDGNELSYYENIGTPSNPVYRYRGDLMEQGSNPYEPSPAFADFDNDGDFDLFVGNNRGYVFYYRNANPHAVLTLNSQPLTVSVLAGSALIDAELQLADADNDSIVTATVIIDGYVAGQEHLSFTASANISGSFDAATGILTFKGKAPVAEYQSILRTVRYHFEAPASGGRQKSPVLATTNRTINWCAIDADGTNAPTVSRTVALISGQPPVFANQSSTVAATHTLTVDLTTLINDPDNNIDLSTLTITQQPGSGALASVNSAGLLTVNYANRAFAGTESLTVRVCDADGSCDESVISITVTNTAPVFNDHTVTLPFAGNTVVDLSSLYTDTEGNVVVTTLQLTAAPISGAVATISGTNLTLNYGALTFSGSENINLQICDLSGACDQAVLAVNITNAPPVITPEPISTPQGSTKTINLLAITSDPDQNLDVNSIEIIEAPESNATASIEIVSSTEVNLILDYSGITFSGVDHLTIRACDAAGACTENVIAIQVDVEAHVVVYNAVAPNSFAGDNKFMRIMNLPEQHRVKIFNRWGDVVFQTSRYDNESVRFEGRNDDGKALPSGTYYYEIEYTDLSNHRSTLNGYLTLKQ